MPLRLTMLAYPAFFIVLAAKPSGVVGKYRKAGAISLDTARKPASVGVSERRWVDDAVRSGVLVAVGDGRFYVDMVAFKRWRRKMLRIFAVVALILASAVSVLWWLASGA